MKFMKIINLNISIKLLNPQLVHSPTKCCLVSEIEDKKLLCANTYVSLVYTWDFLSITSSIINFFPLSFCISDVDISL